MRSSLDPDADLREELDIDSMDFLNLVTALSERLRSTSPKSTTRTSPASAERSTTWRNDWESLAR